MAEKHDADVNRTLTRDDQIITNELGEKEFTRDVTQHAIVPVGLEGVEYGFMQKMRMFDKKYTTTSVFVQMMYRPFLHLRFPVVVW